MEILVLNVGSSSLKAEIYEVTGREGPAPPPPPLWSAHADWGQEAGQATIVVREDGQERTASRAIDEPEDCFEAILKAAPKGVAAVGHRIVHGGPRFRGTIRVSSEVKAQIRALAKFAPAHNPVELAAIEVAERVYGAGTPAFAVFDTAFHATLEPAAYAYPGPYAWLERDIRRYGFHGISYQYVSERALALSSHAADAGGDQLLVACHLGNGCSLAAIRNGRSVDTTMGFTPLDGIMMGTRSGAVDPGILIHLEREEGRTAADLDRLLNQESGLKGLSGVSSDMREIRAAMATGDERAKLAYDVFVHRLVREIGAMVAVLGGCDVLLFTGGIGEHDSALRADVCRRLSFLGIRIDAEANLAAQHDTDLSAPDARVRVLLVKTQEEWQIARECQRLLAEDHSKAGQP